VAGANEHTAPKMAAGHGVSSGPRSEAGAGSKALKRRLGVFRTGGAVTGAHGVDDVTDANGL
jgi:hypothetical protein